MVVEVSELHRTPRVLGNSSRQTKHTLCVIDRLRAIAETEP